MSNFSPAKVLSESWKGQERNTDTWCQQQARALEYIYSEDFDVQGLRALLIEMSSSNQDKAINLLARIFEHLLKVSLGTREEVKHHWRIELDGFMKAFQEVFYLKRKGKRNNQDLINNLAEEIVEDAYLNAQKYYKDDMKKDPSLVQNFDKIPDVCPWSLQDTLDKDVEELLRMFK